MSRVKGSPLEVNRVVMKFEEKLVCDEFLVKATSVKLQIPPENATKTLSNQTEAEILLKLLNEAEF